MRARQSQGERREAKRGDGRRGRAEAQAGGARRERPGAKRDEGGERRERTGERRERTGERPERTGERRERTGKGGERRERTGERPERTGERRERTGERRERTGERPERTGERRERAGQSGDKRAAGGPRRERGDAPRARSGQRDARAERPGERRERTGPAGERRGERRERTGQSSDKRTASGPRRERGDGPRARSGERDTRAERPQTRAGGPKRTRDERPARTRDERPKRPGKGPERTGKGPERTGKGAAFEVEAPKRVPLSPPRGGIQPGDWLFTTREGSEQDLIDELVLANVVEPPAHVLYPSIVVSPRWPKREHQLVPVTFARQALPVQVSTKHADPQVRFDKIVRCLADKLGKAKQYALHVWVPDSDVGNPLSGAADELDARLEASLKVLLPEALRVDDGALRRLGSMPFAQVCLASEEHAVAGVLYSNQALSLAKGGRTRVRLTGDLPSRAARKIEEALAWLGVAPGPGEVCVDLGAAPGGWTYVLSERKARVIAVDPAKLRPEIAARKNVQHVMYNAFQYEPDGRVDWLFCDMAYRPLEVAAMLARWGRRGWARMLVANIKLPMTKKAEILARVRSILEREGEWKHVRTRQLYHDRDEITLTALRA